MKLIIQKLMIIMMIVSLGIVANATIKEKRITLKNGKSKESVTLNPSRTYKFVIDSKEFSKLSVALKTKGGKVRVEIRSPSGKLISNGTGKSFTIRKSKKIEKGDYQIILKNIGNSLASVGLVIGDIKGESK